MTAVRVKARAVDLERVESIDMMGRMRKTLRSMSNPAVDRRLWCHHVSSRHIPRHPIPRDRDTGDRRSKKSSEKKTLLGLISLPFPRMDQLIQWFASQGGVVDAEHFGLAEFPGQGWGAIALKDIPV